MIYVAIGFFVLAVIGIGLKADDAEREIRALKARISTLEYACAEQLHKAAAERYQRVAELQLESPRYGARIDGITP